MTIILRGDGEAAWEVGELTKSRRVHWTKKEKGVKEGEQTEKRGGRHVRDKKKLHAHP